MFVRLTHASYRQSHTSGRTVPAAAPRVSSQG